MDKRTMEMAFQRVIDIDTEARSKKEMRMAQVERLDQQRRAEFESLASATTLKAQQSAQLDEENRLKATHSEMQIEFQKGAARRDHLWSEYINRRQRIAKEVFDLLFLHEEQ